MLVTDQEKFEKEMQGDVTEMADRDVASLVEENLYLRAKSIVDDRFFSAMLARYDSEDLVNIMHLCQNEPLNALEC